MLEILIIIILLGLFFSCHPRMELGNPFQIYFLIWSMIFLGYKFTQCSWIAFSSLLVFALIFVNVVWLIVLFVFMPYMKQITIETRFDVVHINLNLVFFFQILSALALPFVFLKAMELSGGQSIFTTLGYIRLRSAVTEDGIGYGWLAYFLNISYVASSISVMLFKFKKIGLLRLIISLLISLSYSYLSTGRTFILLFFVLHLLPLFYLKIIKLRGLLVGIGALFVGIIVIAAMTSKGIYLEKRLYDNIAGLGENLRGYTIAPLLACSDLMRKVPSPTLGTNVFRFIIAILHAARITGAPPVLVREYAYVPDATNVYTVYEVYFKDFGYFGFIFVSLFSIFHLYLYKKMKTKGNIYLFIYCAACYPLIMQFFQDQYFSLLSTWVQFFFLYWSIFNVKFIQSNIKRSRVIS